MKKSVISIVLVLSGFCFHSAATANSLADPAHRFAGYEPTVFENESQVVQLFKQMESSFKPLNPLFLQFGSQCTQRAETWTYDWYKGASTKSEKVFVFYTLAFKEYYQNLHQKKFKWWFHVSPYLLVKAASGETAERVMDAEFSDKPQSMKEWTDLFIDSKQNCIENVPYANFAGDVTGVGASYDKSAHCYLVRAPMYDMYPMNIDAREQGQKSEMDWDLDQVRFGARALRNSARVDFLERVGL